MIYINENLYIVFASKSFGNAVGVGPQANHCNDAACDQRSTVSPDAVYRRTMQRILGRCPLVTPKKGIRRSRGKSLILRIEHIEKTMCSSICYKADGYYESAINCT